MASKITIQQWIWHKDFVLNMGLRAVLALAGWGKYLGESDGAANVFTAMCWLLFLMGVLFALVTPSTVTRGKPRLLQAFDVALIWVLMGAAAWFGTWWHLGALATCALGVGLQRFEAERRYAEQEAAHG